MLSSGFKDIGVELEGFAADIVGIAFLELTEAVCNRAYKPRI